MKQYLHRPENEKDSCGVGLVVNINGSKEHRIVELGLQTLENMAHRGAENADGRSGDGTGMTVQIPHDFLIGLGIPLPEEGKYGTGIIFLPKEDPQEHLKMFRDECASHGLRVIHERMVPTDSSVLGPLSLQNEPKMVQIFLTGNEENDALEWKLYDLRRSASKKAESDGFYICSLSSRCIVYKGMLTPVQLREYYKDLSDPGFVSALAMVHSRFSTNTSPMWKLAQPFRMLCHNGEINTIKGNRAWMNAREGLSSQQPMIEPGMSDSASLDNVFEFMVMSGRSMANALSMMIPESWNDKNPIPDSLKAYYEYNSILMEPWDGPAAVFFTDGRFAGGTLDRNGLRPARYSVTNDGVLILASESGVIRSADVKMSGRLGPGKMMIVDTKEGRIIHDPEIKGELANGYNHRDWLDRNRLELDRVSSGRSVTRNVKVLEKRLAAHGYTKEEITKIIRPMITEGREPIGSSGLDIPLAVISDRPQRLFNYFRQSFAQVTNPPIDPIREGLVMSVTGYVGHIDQSPFDSGHNEFNVIKVRHPILSNRELDLLKNLGYRGFRMTEIPITFTLSEGLENAVERICKEAEDAVDNGGSYILLSDRKISKNNISVPSLLAVSAVHHHLLRKKKRIQTGIIIESGEPREIMHFSLLFGYGANAVCPYLAYALIGDMVEHGNIKIDTETAERNFIDACEKGVMKVMSKMGVSTIRSYIGAGLFEAIGLNYGFVKKYFGDTASNISGIGIAEIADDVIKAHNAAFLDTGVQSNEGVYGYVKDGERHAWSPAAIKMLQMAASENDRNAYKEFVSLVEGGLFIRDLMDVKRNPIPIEDVEPAESIMKRFSGQAMSIGAICKEAHEMITEAMNLIGGQSNTGEGGDDPDRPAMRNGRDIRPKVKQVASGRFGVTVDYLSNAEEIQIKIAQGAKPGEGGQLMAEKVDEEIAAMRHTLPNITLISPPPHHDIYSIEDLKQLIMDLRCVNPSARISVKVVSSSGVGTVAAGIVKAGADKILISGSDGGTAASPLSSLRYAGMPWELGLAEAQQTLIMNSLRDRVILQTDGQIKTGRDVIIAALLGAEEYGFATALIVSLGCIMCRKCQTNTCPMGISTQEPERRERFSGRSEYVVNYLRFVAEDVREWMSKIGIATMDELIGQSDIIVRKHDHNERTKSIDISRIVNMPAGPRKYGKGQPDAISNVLDRRMIDDVMLSLNNKKADLKYDITNVDRSVGAMLSGYLVRNGIELDDKSVKISFKGTAGQSFGAFIFDGIEFTLKGQANDYVGKGMSGGRLIIYNDLKDNVIAGNTILYGATGGEAYIAGIVGERFCVRNSGAVAVAEGAGDHCCEYMTGGKVVILGTVGRNFAAGMSAGVAYVLNDDGNFDRHCNMDMVELLLVESEDDRSELKTILGSHLKYAGSAKAAEILNDWENNVGRFLKVIPADYRKLLESKGKELDSE